MIRKTGLWAKWVGFSLISLWLMSCVVTVETTTDTTPPDDVVLDESPSVMGWWWGDNGLLAITETEWGDGHRITHLDNETNWVITERTASDPVNPGLFNKHVWIDVDETGGLWVCSLWTDASTAEDAMAAEADSTNPSAGGCDGSSWQYLTPYFQLQGLWESSWGEVMAIDHLSWGSSTLVHFNPQMIGADFAITQYSDDDLWNPGLFAKQVWTDVDEDGGFWQCTTFSDATTAEEARDSDMTADDTDPANGGCVDFPWTYWAPRFELSGAWISDYGELADISSHWWDNNAIVYTDSWNNVAVIQWPEDDAFNAGLFAQLIWTDLDEEDGFWQCTAFFDGSTMEEARDAITDADDSDPAGGGCAGFPWTYWTPGIEVTGTWDTNWSETHLLDSLAWGTSDVVAYDNTANWAITQYPPDDEYYPGLYAKQVWTEPAAGFFWQCTVVFGAPTVEDAMASPEPDATEPSTGGCGDFSWSQFGPVGAFDQIEGDDAN